LLKKERRLKNDHEFRFVYLHGEKSVSRYFVLHFFDRKDGQPTRFGITAGKKIGNAVLRNKLKRVVRELCRANQELLCEGYDLVIVVRKRAAEAKFNDLQKDFDNLMKESGLVRG